MACLYNASMTKHSVNKLMAFDFWRICTAVGLLHAALFIAMPLLPYILSARMSMQVSAFFPLYFFMVLGMLVVGPFHAWLADAFKRRQVLVLSTLGLALVFTGLIWADVAWQVLALSFAGGCCYGIALSAGVTISVDIITSERRSSANRIYALVACVGLLLAALLDPWVFRILPHRQVLLLSIVLLVLSAFIAHRVYVAFRAPIVDKVLSIDRFWLPCTWPLALGVGFFGVCLGMGLSLVTTNLYHFIWIIMGVLLLCTPTIIMAFVNLSHHCQRATACVSYLQSVSMGILVGLGLSVSESCVPCTQAMMFTSLGLSLLLSVFGFSYYKRHKIR